VLVEEVVDAEAAVDMPALLATFAPIPQPVTSVEHAHQTKIIRRIVSSQIVRADNVACCGPRLDLSRYANIRT
jgi:hypothetical protein